MDKAWDAMTRGADLAADEIVVKGRHVAVPRAAGRPARFTFAELCEAPLGARDFLAIAGRYDTIFIDRIPVLAEGKRNEAKRLILLIDTLYDHGTRLVVSAEAPPAGLYNGTQRHRGVRVRAYVVAPDRDAGQGLAGCLGGAA